jgi:hypothetical protein
MDRRVEWPLAMSVPRHNELRFGSPQKRNSICGDPARARVAENQPRGKNLSACADLCGPGDAFGHSPFGLRAKPVQTRTHP